MALVFTGFEERRRERGKVRVIPTRKKRYVYERPSVHQEVLRILRENLQLWPQISEKRRMDLLESFENVTQIDHMNIQLLAATLAFYYSLLGKREPQPDDFTLKNLDPFLERLLPEGERTETTRLKLAANLFRYVQWYIALISGSE